MTEVPNHSTAFRWRRFFNWFPLGLTYATFYMGRYNLNAVKPLIGDTYHFDELQLGQLATVAFWVYALSVIFNGPLADRFGGKRAVLLGAIGVSLLNMLIGALFATGVKLPIFWTLTFLYTVNCYFQSFGALSVVKVNAPWFHIRERGVFSGLFGIMISMGYWFALTGSELILRWMGVQRFWMVFFVPAVAVAAMFLVDLFVVRERPSDSGHPDFDTGELNTDGHDTSPVKVGTVFKKVLAHPVIRIIVLAEFCTGFVRQALMYNFVSFLSKVHHAEHGGAVLFWSGWGVTGGGIVGGLICGYLSDRVFQSRRPPVAFIYYVLQIPTLLALQYAPNGAIAGGLVGLSCMWIFGVHGMLSGAASVDFGGKRAAGTAAGIMDGISYVGAGCATWVVGWVLKNHGWQYWTWTIVPFSAMGALLMLKVWNAQAHGPARSSPATATALAPAVPPGAAH